MLRLLLALTSAVVLTALPACGAEPKLVASQCANLCQRAQYTQLTTAERELLGLCRAVYPCSNNGVPRSVYHFIPQEFLIAPQEHRT